MVLKRGDCLNKHVSSYGGFISTQCSALAVLRAWENLLDLDVVWLYMTSWGCCMFKKMKSPPPFPHSLNGCAICLKGWNETDLRVENIWKAISHSVQGEPDQKQRQRDAFDSDKPPSGSKQTAFLIFFFFFYRWSKLSPRRKRLDFIELKKGQFVALVVQMENQSLGWW